MAVENDLIVDVGMHLGEDTNFYLKKGYRVLGIEADPKLVEHCNKRFHQEIKDGRLIILSGAIAPESAGSQVSFFENQKISYWGTAVPSIAQKFASFGAPSSIITVPRLDTAKVFSRGMPYYLKMDIEGSEKEILHYLQKHQTDRPTYISTESDKIDFSELTAELDLLSALGYKRFKVVQQAIISFLQLKTKSLDGSEFEYAFENMSSGAFGDEALGQWLSYEQALSRYKDIFLEYRLYGDDGILRKIYPWEPRTPGWYDTHATF